MKYLYNGLIYEAKEVSPALLSWFGDSKVVDEEGKPKQVYHGTTHDFDTFKKSKFVNFIFGGIYFTDSPSDAEKNYASGDGGDARARIRNNYKELVNMNPKKLEKLLGITFTKLPRKSFDGGYHYDLVDDMKISDYAKSKVVGENPAPNIMPVYLKIENPFYIDRDSPKYKLKTNPDAPHNTLNIINDQSEGYILLAALAQICNKYKIDWRDLLIKISYGGEFNETSFFTEIVRYEPLAEILNTKPFFVEVLKLAGYDGVIMDPQLYFFGNYSGVRHYIIFNSNQAKSVFNQNPTKKASITKE